MVVERVSRPEVCFDFSCLDLPSLLIYGGAILAKRYSAGSEVEFRVAVMSRRASFSSEFTLAGLER